MTDESEWTRIFFLPFLPQVSLFPYHESFKLNFILRKEGSTQTKGTEFRLGIGRSDDKG